MKTRSGIIASVTAALLALPAATTDAAAAEPSASYAATTSVGVHNAYDRAKYPYFADALDSGAALLELDVWSNGFGGRAFRVSHANPVANDNNCEGATSAARLRTGSRNQPLAGCLADIRAWHDAHPGHRPVLLKVEMKDGFNANSGRGPAELDALLTAKLGDALYRPGDLLGKHADLDEAVRAGGWPARSALAGKFVVELIPGTVEENNPADRLWTDREYATHLRDLAAAGRIGSAAAFPAVHGAVAGDPRTRYADPAIRPWFVFFDGDASTYANGGIDTGWYDSRHYLVVMTDAHKVPPAIDITRPTEAQARERVALMARAHASFATADWYPLPRVLSTVVSRG